MVSVVIEIGLVAIVFGGLAYHIDEDNNKSSGLMLFIAGVCTFVLSVAIEAYCKTVGG